jgi:hypothetical protein
MPKRPLVNGDVVLRNDGRTGQVVETHANFVLMFMFDSKKVEKCNRILTRGKRVNIRTIQQGKWDWDDG